ALLHKRSARTSRDIATQRREALAAARILLDIGMDIAAAQMLDFAFRHRRAAEVYASLQMYAEAAEQYTKARPTPWLQVANMHALAGQLKPALHACFKGIGAASHPQEARTLLLGSTQQQQQLPQLQVATQGMAHSQTLLQLALGMLQDHEQTGQLKAQEALRQKQLLLEK
ncbi:hypothetical protein DUNSADRAFT_18775, partial [Dunaliella salina]